MSVEDPALTAIELIVVEQELSEYTEASWVVMEAVKAVDADTVAPLEFKSVAVSVLHQPGHAVVVVENCIEATPGPDCDGELALPFPPPPPHPKRWIEAISARTACLLFWNERNLISRSSDIVPFGTNV